jgi:hypothetical protein
MLQLHQDMFPSANGFTKAKWAPVLLRPIFDSPEQVVIGVIAVSPTGFAVERANDFGKLKCLFGENAELPIVVAQSALDAITTDLSQRGLNAVTEYTPLFSGVSVGQISEAEGSSLQQIASSWLRSISSLCKPEYTLLQAQEPVTEEDLELPSQSTDRLPNLVLDYVSLQRPGLTKFFNSDIIESARKRRRISNIHGVIIDFAGSKVVANFGTLNSATFATSVDRIKRRLWDLKIDRDAEKGSWSSRTHEMIVQHPANDDPQISEKQYARIAEALGALEEQADQEEIRFRPLTSVPQIGDHILKLEAA